MWKPDYVAVSAPYDGSAKQYLRIPDTDDTDDVQLGLHVSAASRAVDRATLRQFGRDAAVTTRYYTAEYDWTIRKWIVRVDDMMSVDALVVMSAGQAITGATPWPLNAAAEGKPWTELRLPAEPADHTEHLVSVTERFGWLAIPKTVQDATLLQMARFFKRADAPFGVAGSPDSGSEIRLLAKVDPDVAVMLSDFVRRWVAA